MKTFNQLKKDLKIAKELKCLYHSVLDRTNTERIINIVNTKAIIFKTSVSLRYPESTKLIDYHDNEFSFYERGKEYISDDIFKEWKDGNDKLLSMGYNKHYQYMLDNPTERKRKDELMEILHDYSNLNCDNNELPYKWSKDIRGVLLYTFKIIY